MALPTIFDICRPRPDVLAVAVADTDFAADLAQVLTGKASADYREPGRFFANTFPTRGLKNLLVNVCRRLSGTGGAVGAIFRLDTSYGSDSTNTAPNHRIHWRLWQDARDTPTFSPTRNRRPREPLSPGVPGGAGARVARARRGRRGAASTRRPD